MHRGTIVVAGGLSPDAAATDQNISDRVMAYSPEIDSWCDLTRLPQPRHHGYLLSFNDELLLFGGFIAADGGRWSASRDVLCLHGDRWEQITQMPDAQCETVATSHAGAIHLVGGRAPHGASNADWNDHADIAAHRIFQSDDNSWHQAAPAPTTRNSAAGVVIYGHWYVVGGRTVSGGNLAVNRSV
ncbi:MAG: hypothetical protein Tsb002_19050 [Wenzhouxiangellaceae bacterium]